MSKYRIVTDSSCDLPQELADQLELLVQPLALTVDDKTYLNYLDGREMPFPELFAKFRAGAKTSTSGVNPEAFRTLMEPVLQAGEDVLYIGFSSGLSTTFQSGVIAAQELAEQYPERKVLCVDSLCASLGQGLLVYLAAKKRQQGAELEELAQYVEDMKLKICHWFTVDDLMYLKRGGRIPAGTAILGTALQIKPVMRMENDGKLHPFSKARGRKAAIAQLVKQMGENGVALTEQTVFICHGDCLADAEYAAKLIREQHGVKEIIINYVGPVIGSHAGPGVLSIFYVGTER